MFRNFYQGGASMKSLFRSIVILIGSFSFQQLLFGQNSDYDFLANPNASHSEFMADTPFGLKVLLFIFLIGIMFFIAFLFAGYTRVKQDEKEEAKKKQQTKDETKPQ
jgi:hypothetical protein